MRWIEASAVALTRQGRRTAEGRTYGAIGLSALIRDITERSGTGIPVMARVHRDNTRSLRLLSQHGFIHSRPAPGSPYLEIY